MDEVKSSTTPTTTTEFHCTPALRFDIPRRIAGCEGTSSECVSVGKNSNEEVYVCMYVFIYLFVYLLPYTVCVVWNAGG
jgi:hypothetical protein